MSIFGYDLSKWDYPADYQTAFDAGIRFGYLKASEGLAVDRTYEKFRAQPAPFPMGAFHFYRELGERGAERQAELFAGLACGLTLPPVLDWEIDNGSYPNARRFLDRVEAVTGRKPMIYTSRRYWRLPFESAAEYDLWVAHYTIWPYPALPAPWKTWKLWQYTDRGSGPKYGVKGAQGIDLNRFNGDECAFAAWATVPPFVEPPAPSRVRLLSVRNIRTLPNLTGKVTGRAEPGIYLITGRETSAAEQWAQIDRGWVNVVINGNVYGEWM